MGDKMKTKSLVAGLAVSALLFGAVPVLAQDWSGPGYAPPPATYNFYGQTTNYFGPAPAYGDGGYGGGYAPAAPVYSGYYGAWQDDLPPAAAYDDMRADPWHGYDPYFDDSNGW